MSNDPNEIQGKRYQIARERIGLSREMLARILGSTRQSIHNRERGIVSIKSEHWLALQNVSAQIGNLRVEDAFTMPEVKVLSEQVEIESTMDHLFKI